MPVLHHVLLAAAVTALGAAGLRTASLVAPRGLERVLSAAAFGFAAAVGEVLLLGLFGLGGNAYVLAAAALLTWLATLRLPAPEVGPGSELAAWWSRLGLVPRLVAGALAGAWVVWVAWLLRHPSLGFDTALYHLSEAAVWEGSGHTGGTDLILRGLPVTNYPITDEVFLSWMLGLSHSLVPASLLVPPQVVLLGAAGWLGLRTLRVPVITAALAVAALCSLPAVIAWQSNGAAPDPAALAWLVTCGALCAAARARPLLLAPALVAGGLSIGTKTTTAPLAIVVLALGAWGVRDQLRGFVKPLALALLAATVTGGVWYLRNLFDHGSPLWPFIAAPWGDPLPPAVRAANASFLDNPHETLSAVGDLYLQRFLGPIVLLGGALVAPLLGRRRPVFWASLAAALSFLVWARAPFTGVPPLYVRVIEGTFSTTRYLLPGIAAAILALALAGTRRDIGGRIAQLVLATATCISLIQAFNLGFPAMPRFTTPLAGAVAGAAAAAVLGRIRMPRPLPSPLLLLGVLVLGALLAVPARGYLKRHASTGVFGHRVDAWLAARPDDGRRVSSAPLVLGPLAGERLRHRLEPIPVSESCAAMRNRARDGYVVLYVGPPADRQILALAGCLAPRRPDYSDREFRVWAPAAVP